MLKKRRHPVICPCGFVDEDEHATLTGVTLEPTNAAVCDGSSLQQLLQPLVHQQRDTADRLAVLTSHVQALEQQIRASFTVSRWRMNITERDIAILFIAIFTQLFFVWLFR